MDKDRLISRATDKGRPVEFQIGDRVVVSRYREPYNQNEGEIIGADSVYWTVELDELVLGLQEIVVNSDEITWIPPQTGSWEPVGYIDQTDHPFTPDDPVDQVLDKIGYINRKKRQDYASDSDPFSNFREAGMHSGVDALTVVETLIGVKTARLRNLLDSTEEPNNESLEDTLIDRATYAVIAAAMWREGKNE